MNDSVIVVDTKMRNIANAIAYAEGYGVKGAIPTLYNNPGDLIGSDGKKQQFPSVEAGWQALFHQIHLMTTGLSHYYKPTMTWEEIGKVYDGEAMYINWVDNVCFKLAVTSDSTLQQYLDS